MKNQYTKILEQLQETTDHALKDFYYLEGSVESSGLEDPAGKKYKYNSELEPRAIQLKAKLQRIESELNKMIK